MLLFGEGAMITIEELEALMADLESDRVERTVSTKDTDKFCEAVCAFANDYPNHRQPGRLLIGVGDDGRPAGLTITGEFLASLGGTLRSAGNILPLPSIVVEKVTLPEGRGDVAVVAVEPSDLPPVRYKGRCHIRVGPRRALASETEERRLSERRTALARAFDATPCVGSRLEDLSLDLFTLTYLRQAVAAEVIEENRRDIKLQLASLRFFDLSRDCPTYAGILLFGKDPRYFLPGAYVQFVRFAGTNVASTVLTEVVVRGDLTAILRELDSIVAVNGRRWPEPVPGSVLREQTVEDYPAVALRELLTNAVMHRWYEGSTAPIRLSWFPDRVEIQSPGGLYGEVTPENFREQTAYRNPVLAEALNRLGYANRFGRGVLRADEALERNGNPLARFRFDAMYVLATVERRP